ncbi:3-carboxyethylcatechol 2,3-dioxygenase [Sphingobium sp. SJ10-10]|uniref:3-carboxyethylcatechol 2,3-dioxygenase n=1 Tax=unclassified Sphingobium TaxID=2611147 RepID=UPI0007704820|nr:MULTISPECIES: 3-carboxyethylcatechol 2,3-dioxygenase [unclassified Sphingobium]AMK24672.1 3-(2,3-dihydroxyphenyl)propionate dioxygenase [Sphingobium sp. TKS]MEC6698201.1 3-carboxyethylcatechol 2,3-dioxygenase [Sphingobium sp. SJ10-10]
MNSLPKSGRLALACASHSPLMEKGECEGGVRETILAAFRSLAGFIDDFGADLIIQFSPDHFNSFFYNMMPTFCVGISAESIGDWGTATGPLSVPVTDAEELAGALIAEGFDITTSRRMTVDHGFVQIWEQMFGSFSGLPIIPIFINCIAPPSPTTRRVREIGEAVGRFALGTGKRVLIVSSGGLSHDPPIPRLATSSPDVRAQLIDGPTSIAAARQEREKRTLAVSHEASRGSASILPVSEQWDRQFLNSFRFGKSDIFDTMQYDHIVREGGRAGPEVLCWIAALAALRVGGAIHTDLYCYEAIQGWLSGMAILSGVNEEESVRDI